jgi:hypothetical protein
VTGLDLTFSDGFLHLARQFIRIIQRKEVPFENFVEMIQRRIPDSDSSSDNTTDSKRPSTPRSKAKEKASIQRVNAICKDFCTAIVQQMVRDGNEKKGLLSEIANLYQFLLFTTCSFSVVTFPRADYIKALFAFSQISPSFVAPHLVVLMPELNVCFVLFVFLKILRNNLASLSVLSIV